MKKEEITKETFIALWNKSCKEQNSPQSFEIAESQNNPFYILNVEGEKDIMLTTSSILTGPTDSPKYNYSSNIVFGEFIEYVRFDLDKSEYESLVDLFKKQSEIATKKNINRIVENTEGKLFNMIKSCEV